MTGSASGAVVLAHGGGVPEAAMVGVPVLVLGLFAVLERRARRREAAQERDDAVDEHENGDT